MARHVLFEMGIRRLGSKEDGFSYRYPEGDAVREERVLGRIEGLKIPPAYRDARIARAPSAKVQAVGHDARGRLQYMSTTPLDKLRQNPKSYREQVEEIRGDWTSSDRLKGQELSERFAKASARHSELVREYRGSKQDRLTEARKAAFAAPKVKARDDASLMASYRDALDRADAIRDTGELRRLLERSEVGGDALMTRAILHRGYHLQDEHLVGAALEADPQHKEAWGEFCEAAESFNQLEMMGVPRPEPEPPRELQNPALADDRGEVHS